MWYNYNITYKSHERGGSSAVECLLPKEKVGSSNLLHRSISESFAENTR